MCAHAWAYTHTHTHTHTNYHFITVIWSGKHLQTYIASTGTHIHLYQYTLTDYVCCQVNQPRRWITTKRTHHEMVIILNWWNIQERLGMQTLLKSNLWRSWLISQLKHAHTHTHTHTLYKTNRNNLCYYRFLAV